ncbi:MAG: leucine-rich repeat domain-containing protein, partial [Treponema sp.]|nr:leucine-rich repeat domain-containing protein [Treponema sp.]
GFEFEKGWQIDGSFAPAGSIIGVASGGDVNLQDRAEFKIAEYGYKPDGSGYILGFNPNELTADDTVTVTTDRKITKLQLPSTSINLDLSGATDFKTVNLTADNPGNLTSIILPSNAETIYGSAFSGCTNLTSVTLPSTLTSIQNEAFSGCDHLPSITIPAGVTTLADDTFNGCSSLSSVTFAPGSHLTTINKRVFKGCSSLSTITLPSTVTSIIGESAFENCSNLASIVIPDGVNEIKDNAFKNCNSLAAITIPASLQYMRASLTSVASGCTITYKGSNSFQVNTLPTSSYNVILEGGVPKFSNGTPIFRSDTNLTSVTYKGGPSLSAYAFDGCTNLTTVTFNSYPSVIQTTPLPDNVHNIIFKSGLQPIGNVKDVGNLFPSTMNYSTLTVTFDNDSSNPGITINPNAFNFTGANLITYTFTAHPNTNMTYDNGNCFPDGKTMVFSSTNFTWKDNGSTGYWQ